MDAATATDTAPLLVGAELVYPEPRRARPGCPNHDVRIVPHINNTPMNSPPQLVGLARKAAAAQSLDPALVCAVIEQESAWNPWAIRYEPTFFAKYVAHLYTNNKITASEAYARGFSWGLMQVMGQVAREMGFDGAFLSATCDPEQGLAIGCKLLRKKIDAMDGDTTRGLLAWNGGGNPAYPAQVLARRAHYL
jgi:soluble lytic murein transglycosylase-like protein